MRPATPAARLALGATALLAAGLLAACDSAAHRAAPTPASQPPARRSAVPIPSEALGYPPGVVLSPQAAYGRRGPFVIQPQYCGHLSRGQRSRYGTAARGGLVYRYTNTSAHYTGAPSLTVNFLRGTRVVGSNVAGDLAAVAPGQSADAEVDAVGLSGQPVTFTRCELMDYATTTPGGAVTGNYAP